MMRKFFALLLAPFLILMTCCSEDIDLADQQKYLEGEQIPGTEFFFPMGFYNSSGRTPKISPDGKYLAYQAPLINESISGGLYVMELATQEKRLLHPQGYEPDWSPDGEWIAFNTFPQIHKIKVDGDSLTQLTFDGENFIADWSPDGKLIAYDRSISDSLGPSGIWVMKNDGSMKEYIFGAGFPQWFPSGEKILGVTGVSSTSIETKFTICNFFTKNIKTVLTATKDEDNRGPQVSPDGRRIVYWNSQGIWIMNIDGSHSKRILPNHLYNSRYEGDIRLRVDAPSWHPDGEHIIYGHFQITSYKRPSSDPEVRSPVGTTVEGYISFYKVHVDSALAVSNL